MTASGLRLLKMTDMTANGGLTATADMATISMFPLAGTLLGARTWEWQPWLPVTARDTAAACKP